MTHSSGDTDSAYTGQERRESPRIPAQYPICVRFAATPDETIERFAQTRNVSAGGVFFTCMDSLEIGTKVAVLVGIPAAYGDSVPAAQLEGEAVVMRCASAAPPEHEDFRAAIALKFLGRPTLTTEVSMFD